jgi:hypothetical protein
MIALGGITISAAVVMRDAGISTEWRPESEATRYLPLHAFHARLHELEPLTRDTSALHAAIVYPEGVIPVLVKDTPASEGVLSALSEEAPPACVISGKLCRASNRLPKSDRYLSLYGEIKAEEGAEGEEGVNFHQLRMAAEDLDRKTREALTGLGTPGVPIWFLGGEEVASAPFGAKSVGARAAVNAALAFSVVRLLVFHTFSACGS